MKQLNEFTLGDIIDIAEIANERYAANYKKVFGDKRTPPTISSAIVQTVLQVAAEITQEANNANQ